MLKRLTSRNHKLNEENYEHYTIQIKEEDGEEENYDNRLGIDNSYSYIEKANFKRARYKVINDVEDMKNVINVLNDWKLSKPKLIVSVTGGAGQFILPSRIKTAFKYGIAKIAESTDALIITGGTQTGVMKLVGEGMAKYYQKDDIKLLGVASWECTKFRNELLEAQNSQTKNGYVYDFNLEKSEVPKGMALLDRNHSHFILVRNLKNVEALQKTGIAPFGGEIEFRNKLEESLRKNSNISIPTILIVLNGGKNTIKTVELSIKNKVPVLLIAESEGCADLIAKILIHYTKSISKFNINDFEKDMLDIQIKPDELERMKKSLLAICDGAKNKLINVFNFDKGEDLEISIIKTFLNSRSEKEKLHDNLNLALKWNKIDIATNDIFNGKEEFTSKQLNQSLEMALVYNRPQFVELLLENKLVLDDFFTSKRLYYLYNAIVDKDTKQAPFRNLYKKQKLNPNFYFTFEDIKRFIQNLTEVPVKFLPQDFFLEKKDKEEIERKSQILKNFICDAKKLEDSDIYGYTEIKFNHKVNPALNLFLWAILFNRIEIAKIFLQHGESQIFFCLLASHIMKYFSERSKEEKFNDASLYFENLAIEILDLFDKNESDFLNDNLLLTKNTHFSVHLLKFANKTKSKQFMATSCAQKVLNEIWSNGMLFSAERKLHFNFEKFGLIKMTLSFASLGLLSPFFQSFNDENGECKNSNTIKKNHINEVCRERIVLAHRLVVSEKHFNLRNLTDYQIKYKNFMYSPRSHFVYETVFYLIFLALFSVLMLSQFKYYDLSYLSNSNNNNSSLESSLPVKSINKLNWLEYLLIFWMFSSFCHELRQLNDNDGSIFRKLSTYFLDGWNQFDMTGIFLFLIGMILRIVSIYQDEYLFRMARLILCIDLAIWYIRLLQVSICFRSLGPKLVMIRKMLKDLTFFILIITIFVFAYGISTHSILYPDKEANLSMIRSFIDLAYWPIYGEISFKSELENPDKYFLEEGVAYGYISTMIYMCIANVLLLNLLIAMFSSTYSDLEKSTDTIWKFQNYALIHEYDQFHKNFPFPPPFNLLTYMINLFDRFFCTNENDQPDEYTEDLQIIEKEQKYSVIILKKEKELESEKEGSILRYSAEKLKILDQKSNEMNKILEKLYSIEQKVNQNEHLKKNIMNLSLRMDELTKMNEKFIKRFEGMLNIKEPL